MTPLQRIALGMLVVAIPADFPHQPHPGWRHYDALPDPLGWLLVLSGLWALGRLVDVDYAKLAAVVSLLVSVPLWIPQVARHLTPEWNDGLQPSVTWAISLPPFVFGLAFSVAVSRRAQVEQPRDTYVAGRFGLLGWAFAASAILPVIGYNLPLDDQGLNGPLVFALALVFVVQLAFVYFLFRVHARPWLGGPDPAAATTTAAPENPERPS